jgi:hypothetical protein
MNSETYFGLFGLYSAAIVFVAGLVGLTILIWCFVNEKETPSILLMFDLEPDITGIISYTMGLVLAITIVVIVWPLVWFVALVVLISYGFKFVVIVKKKIKILSSVATSTKKILKGLMCELLTIQKNTKA